MRQFLMILLWPLCLCLTWFPMISPDLEAAAPPSSSQRPKVATATIAADELVYEILKRSNQSQSHVAVSGLAADQRYSHLPASYLKNRQVVGNHIESLLSSKAELVIMASYNRPELVAKVKAAGLKVHLVETFQSLDAIRKCIKDIGNLLKQPAAAQELIDDFDKAINDMTEKASAAWAGQKPQVLSYNAYGTVMGLQTSFNAMLKPLLVENVAARLGMKGWQKLNPEVLLTEPIDAVIIAYDTPDDKIQHRKNLQIGPWSHTKAVKENRLIFVQEKDLLSVNHHVINGMRTILDQLVKIQRKTKDAQNKADRSEH